MSKKITRMIWMQIKSELEVNYKLIRNELKVD